MGKFSYSKAKCIIGCRADARGGSADPADCLPPYGGKTLACVTLAESKGVAAETTGCAKDCPDCYTGGDCIADAAAKVADVEGKVDAIAVVVYCDDASSPDGFTRAEEKCEDTTAKYLTKYSWAKLKCLAKCHRAEHAGKVPLGNCALPTPLDPRTTACLAGAVERTTKSIDRFCDGAVRPGSDRPECGLYPTSTTAEWIGLVEAAIADGEPRLFCSSSSPAFLD